MVHGGRVTVCDCNHLRIVAETMKQLEMTQDDLIEWTAAHDLSCSAHENSACCNCNPRISMTTIGGDVLIEETGEVSVQCRA